MISCMCTWHSMHRIQYGAGKSERKETRMTCIQFHKIYVRFMKIKIRRLNTSRGLLEKIPSSSRGVGTCWYWVGTFHVSSREEEEDKVSLKNGKTFSIFPQIDEDGGNCVWTGIVSPSSQLSPTQLSKIHPSEATKSSICSLFKSSRKEEPKSDDDDEVNRDWNLNSLFSRLSLWHWQQTKVDQLEASGASGGYEISLNSSLRLF